MGMLAAASAILASPQAPQGHRSLSGAWRLRLRSASPGVAALRSVLSSVCLPPAHACSAKVAPLSAIWVGENERYTRMLVRVWRKLLPCDF
jgi:hypothetical protein